MGLLHAMCMSLCVSILVYFLMTHVHPFQISSSPLTGFTHGTRSGLDPKAVPLPWMNWLGGYDSSKLKHPREMVVQSESRQSHHHHGQSGRQSSLRQHPPPIQYDLV